MSNYYTGKVINLFINEINHFQGKEPYKNAQNKIYQMNPILEKALETKVFIDSNNQAVKIHSETPRGQCEFLQKIITENEFKNSIEIGFAFGLSTLAILESISKKNGSHCVIDPFETTHWQGIGLELVKQAGYSSSLEFIGDYSYKVLPKFLEQGRKFDFAYIDSIKMFDGILVDFFFLDKILNTGGIIVFDDVQWPGIRKVLRYISQFPNYMVYAQLPKNKPESKTRKIMKLLKKIPKSYKIFKEDILLSDFDLGINTICVAIKKIGPDNRNWDWHTKF